MHFTSPPSPAGNSAHLASGISALADQLRGSGLAASADVDSHIRELLEAVFEALPHFVAIVAPDGKLLYLNSAACKLTGVTSGAGHPLGLIFGDEALTTFTDEALPAAQRQGQWHSETMWRGRDNRVVPVAQLVMTHRSSRGDLRFISVVARDISHLRAAESLLREQAALLDKAHDAVILKSLDDRVLRWSGGAARIYGWTAEEAVGRPVTELLRISDETYSHARQTTGSDGNWSGELRKMNKQGRELFIDSRWTLIHDSAGKVTSVLSLDSDITDHRKLEQQMLRAQRMESIGSLAGGIAHDLNNILTPIVMGVALLQSRSPDSEASKTLATMERSAARGTDLVRQVLSFARGMEGKRAPVSPAMLIRDLQKMVIETFPKSIVFETDIDRNVGTVLGDMTQLHQVMLNLIVNARDAMVAGGRMVVSAYNTFLDDGYVAMHTEARTGLHVILSVVDTGSGIPQEIIDKIFDPFFTTKEEGHGTGLGLSTAYAIVKGHGGFINVYSEVGKGTQVRVYLPAQQSGPVAEPEQTTRELPRGRGEHVLVVDDEEGVSSVVVRTLERYGYRASSARNGAEAVAVYVRSQTPVDVVLTDMAMPIMDGPAAILALRSIDPKVRVIGASGLGSNDKFVSALGAGVEHFLQKPFTAEALLRTMRLIIEGKGPDKPKTA